MAVRGALTGTILIIASLLLSGCLTLPDPEVSQESNREYMVFSYHGDATVGQTFTARRAGLNGLTFWANLDPGEADQQAWVAVRLYQTLEVVQQGGQALFQGHFGIRGNGPVTISLPPRSEAPGHIYYLELTPSVSNISFLGQNVDAYGGGTAYAGRVAIPGDLAFRTTYLYGPGAVLEDLVGMAGQAWLLIPLGMVLWLPGWLLLDLSGLRRRFDWGERVAISVGLSLALVPLMMLWTSTLGLHWSQPALLGAVILLGVIMLWRMWRGFRPITLDWISLLLGIVFTVSLAVRLMMVRDLVAPAWVDSVHHALITRLIMEGGAFPTSYAPYLQLPANIYHAGYHSGLAAFLWLSEMDLPQGMLYYGQVLNAACVFAVYLLTTQLSGDRRAALLAAFLCALFTPMPAYYVSWGRYTQLAGLLILPVSLAFIKLVLDNAIDERMRPEPNKAGESENLPVPGQASHREPSKLRGWLSTWALPLGMSCLAAAGSLLVHYRATAFLACLLVGYAISQLFDWQDLRASGVGNNLIKLLVAGSLLGLGALLLTLPGMVEVIRERLLPAFSPGNIVPGEAFADFPWRLLEAGYGMYTLWLAGFGLCVGLVLRKRFIATIIFWVVLMFTMANLGSLGLPGGGVINNTSVAITLFMPIALLGGYATSRMMAGMEWILLKKKPALILPTHLILLSACLILAVAGARQMFSLVNVNTYLFRSADLQALSWLKDNLPQNEPVLTNPFNWGYGLYAGNDGGAWISALSGQATLPPPVIYGFGDRDELERVNSLSAQVIQHGANPDELWALMREADISYVYTGARGGPISSTALLSSPLFDALYAQAGTYVFKTLGW